MGAYIMDHFIDRERARALLVITKAYVLKLSSIENGIADYQPSYRYRTIPLSFIEKELGFDSTLQAREFLQEHRAATFTNPNSPDAQAILDCKPASAPLAQVFEEKYRKVQIRGAV